MILLPCQSKEAVTSARLLADLIQNGLDIGDEDALIAGIMLENDCRIIIPSNDKHFQRVEGLVVINQQLEPKEVVDLVDQYE